MAICLLAAGSLRPATAAPNASGALPRISFLNDVEPILTHAGCNAGACHGSQFGKGGFKLSLAAYDPDLDYQSIARVAGGRRLNRTEPERSLFLRKPAVQIAHQGGLRLGRGGADYRALLTWLRQGARGPDPHDPSVVALSVDPEKRVLRPGQKVTLRVIARYSDGTRRDVTAHTRINTLNDAIATATPDGLVCAAGRGATAIMLRYDGLAGVAHILVPYRSGGSGSRQVQKTDDGGSFVDRWVAARWRDLRLEPSPVCSDYAFIRRASLDIIGTLPTADEVRTFAAKHEPDKRARLVDALLDRPEYADYWTVKWCDLLRASRSALGAKPAAALTEWVRTAFARNVPYDRFVRALLTAQGRADTVAPANYYRVAPTSQELAETTSQLFLGVRLQCARCLEKWSQTDYYRFAAFFARVGQVTDAMHEPVVALRPSGEVTHPKTGARMEPCPPLMDGSPAFARSDVDRRAELANWLTSKDNLPFARMLVNRYWAYLLGRGIVEPVDDVRVTNPPSNPDLLEALARDFIRSGFDIKHLIRTICTSKAYQLSSQGTAQNRADQVFYSHFLPKRQPAEVMLDSIGAATGVQEKFAGVPQGMRAIQLPDSGVASMFLDTFGRPPRSSACECERTGEPSLPQALQLLNGETVNRKICAPIGKADQLAASAKRNEEIVTELYLSTLSRPPSAGEAAAALAAFRSRPRQQATEDLLWALLNTKEFLYIR